VEDEYLDSFSCPGGVQVIIPVAECQSSFGHLRLRESISVTKYGGLSGIGVVERVWNDLRLLGKPGECTHGTA